MLIEWVFAIDSLPCGNTAGARNSVLYRRGVKSVCGLMREVFSSCYRDMAALLLDESRTCLSFRAVPEHHRGGGSLARQRFSFTMIFGI